ncbi:MAG: OmpA family protein [Betaproteobacteria bacterium]|nr:OmpA family protein [Betaproteobacteria bacterium]
MSLQRLLVPAFVLLLSGCAAPQPAGDDGLSRRLAEIETRQAQGQSGAALLGEIGKKLEALTSEQQALRARMQEIFPPQQAQEVRLGRAEQQIRDLATRQLGALASGDAASRESRQRQGELGQRLEAMTGELRAVQEALATRSSGSDLARAEQRQREAADALAARIARLEQRLDEVARTAQDALDATGFGQRKIYGKVLFSVTLTEDKTLFPINSPDLGAGDQKQLDALAPRLKELGTSFHLHIEGHTDGIGPDDYNYELGKARAEVVKRYLNERWDIPLLRMSVTSHGATAALPGKPNRRIVVQVMQ